MGVPVMTVGACTRVLCFLLLVYGIAAAQHTIDTTQCTDEPEARPTECLPEAPSAVRQTEYRNAMPIMAVPPRRKLSPAERPFSPLTDRQKFDRFLRSMYSPYTIFNGLYDATWDQATGGKARYGGGVEGWGDRMGASIAGTASRQFFGTFLFPSILNQDPRYFAMYHGSVWKRFVHAVSRTALTKGDDGHTQLDVSTWLAIGATETLQNTWLPPGDRGFDQTVTRIIGSFQGTATSYLVREFSPDLIHFFKRHSPVRLRKIADKIPERMITGMPPDTE